MDGYLGRRFEEFIAAVEYGSISRAARELGLTQPAVSRQIAALEAQAGDKLLVRTSRGVTPTEAGQLLYNALSDARAGIDEALAAIRRSAGSDQGRLLIGTNRDRGSLICSQALPAFKKEYPQLEVEVRSFDDAALIEGSLDGAIDVIEAPRLCGFDDRDYEFFPCLCDQVIIAVPPTHRLAARRGVALADLAGETIVMYPKGTVASPVNFYDDILYNAPDVHIVSPGVPVSPIELVTNGWLCPCLSRYIPWMHPMVAVFPDWPTDMEVGLLVRRDSPNGRVFAQFAQTLLQETPE